MNLKELKEIIDIFSSRESIEELELEKSGVRLRIRRASANHGAVAAVAIAAGMRVDDLARVPLSFPTYAGALGRVAAKVTRQLNLTLDWQGGSVDLV